MPAGLVRCPASSAASRGFLFSTFPKYQRTSQFRAATCTSHVQKLYSSSIADAMLGRAVKQSQPAPPPNNLAKLFDSSSPAQDGNIKDQFNKARPSQSIGGFTSYRNSSNPSNELKPLRTRSPNLRKTQKPRIESLKIGSAVHSTHGSIFSKPDSFRETPIDITSQANLSIGIQPPVHFDENDFDDDLDLDNDFDDIPFSVPMAAPPKIPSSRRQAKSPSPYNLPQLSCSLSKPQQVAPSSSAITWESSSPSHRRTPPGAALKRQREEATSRQTNNVREGTGSNTNPPPAKRRTLPWARRAEPDEIASRAEEEEEAMAYLAHNSSSPIILCKRCNMTGHTSTQCPKSGKWGYTPQEKKMPWNTTGSAIREEKMKFKEKQKAASRKIDAAQRNTLEDHQRATLKMAPITLSQEQQRVLDLVVNKSKSVFFTGSAGTGKSVLMRSIIAELRKKYAREPERVAVTASTGLAACNIGGVTLHSFGGIGLGKEDVPALVKKIKRNPKAKNRWLKTKILVIDEISMVDGDLFDKLEGIARSMRNNGRPFGGIQLVITGDFFQLPPVPEYDNKSRGIKFAFDAGTWATAIHHTIGLTEVFRQKDPIFANMLNEMRLGKITEDTIKAFRKLNRKPSFVDSLEATELFPTRNEVENANSYRMRNLVGKSYRYEAADTGTITDQAMRDKLLSNMMAPKAMELKKGAQVMLIKNMDDNLVNGSLGKVIAFMSEVTFEIYDKNPEILEEGDMEALSEEAKEKPSLTARFSKSKEPSPNTGKEYPLVRFSVADGTWRDLLVMPEEWKIELPTGEVQAQRTQLPLILAWALSIHKAQGQTLERVKIDLKKIFEKGQAYVALSRAVSQEGLEVHNFDKSKVMAHPRVAQFYNSLYSVNKALQNPTIATASKSTPKSNNSQTFDQFADEEELMAAYG